MKIGQSVWKDISEIQFELRNVNYRKSDFTGEKKKTLFTSTDEIAFSLCPSAESKIVIRITPLNIVRLNIIMCL